MSTANDDGVSGKGQDESKSVIRAQTARRVGQQSDLAGRSRQIRRRLLTLPEYQAAETVAFYVSMRDEVCTHECLPVAVASGKQVAVPYCIDDDLELCSFECLDELRPGTWGILEPDLGIRRDPARRIPAAAVDLIVVPGVAFDRQGGRIGHGKGYYDRFLRRTRSDALKVALAFECQMVSAVPMLPHDVAMNLVITEEAVYRVDR